MTLKQKKTENRKTKVQTTTIKAVENRQKVKPKLKQNRKNKEKINVK